MILIKSRLHTMPIDTEALKKDIEMILKKLGYSDFDVGILLTTDKTIRRYNKQYRSKDQSTDVLSFPFYPNVRAGQRITAKNEAEKNLGDIIISLERVRRDAQKVGRPLEAYLRAIVVHGISHLLGYTHDTEKDYKQMQKKEDELLDVLKKPIS